MKYTSKNASNYIIDVEFTTLKQLNCLYESMQLMLLTLFPMQLFSFGIPKFDKIHL